MKNSLFLILCFFAVEIFGQDFVANEIYVKLKSVALMKSCNSENDLANLNEFKNSLSMNMLKEQVIEEVKASFFFCNSSEIKKTFRVKVSASTDIKDLLIDLKNDPNVEHAERIPVMKKNFSPNDLGAFSNEGQWALHKIRAKEAWDIGKGNPAIVVAVVDDAIDTDHEDLKGICLPGRDVADGDNDTRPVSNCHAHGTSVAGIVGAATNNSIGVASIGYGISILPVKIVSDADSNCQFPNLMYGYEGVLWAADNGAHVINLSWVGGLSFIGQSIISYASSKGIILVAAAGNSNNSDLLYPAAYDNVIGVAATDIDDKKSNVSSYGEKVDIAAPGDGIKTTFPFNNYGLFSGTSTAAPMVAGLLGLIWSADITKDFQSIIDCVLNTTDNIDAKNPDYVGLLGTGRMNAFKAILCVSPFPVCEFNKRFTEPISGFLNQQVKANIFGLGSNVILPGADVTYDAGDLVQLLPGFKALRGSRFRAFIDGCESLSKITNDDGNESSEIGKNNLALNLYPNPANQFTRITYHLHVKDQVSISLFDATGKYHSSLVHNQPQNAGQHHLKFNASNLPTGIYYIKLQSNENNITKKLMITK